MQQTIEHLDWHKVVAQVNGNGYALLNNILMPKNAIA
jgi:hypothetical protein